MLLIHALNVSQRLGRVRFIKLHKSCYKPYDQHLTLMSNVVDKAKDETLKLRKPYCFVYSVLTFNKNFSRERLLSGGRLLSKGRLLSGFLSKC